MAIIEVLLLILGTIVTVCCSVTGYLIPGLIIGLATMMLVQMLMLIRIGTFLKRVVDLEEAINQFAELAAKLNGTK